MTRPIQIDPRALAEAAAAARWYDEQRPGYGTRFRQEVDTVIARIADHPDGYQSLQGSPSLRRAFTRRFPFVVIYRVTDHAIQVLGVMPTRTNPAAASLLVRGRTT